MATATHPLQTFILKVAARCNLNCSYCYVFNKGDLTWKLRPAIMTEATFEAALGRIRRHCERSGQETVTLSFHGGEPCLIGAERFDAWCTRAQQVLGDVAEVRIALQTNGTLLNQAWADAFLKHRVQVGISMDGPKQLHDVFRIDLRGRGSYDAVERGLTLLQGAGVPFGILSVIQLGTDPLLVHRHFRSLGCKSISYLMPDFTHDTIAETRQRHGATPCADFLIPVFDEWWLHDTIATRINPFWQIARAIVGGESQTDSLGNEPLGFAVVETDGSIEGLDVLRICEEGLTQTGLNVHGADFRDISEASPFHHQVMFEGTTLPQACRSCPEAPTCGGGHLPHRYARAHGFDNPSVWCADLLALFAHIRSRLGISVAETARRRQALQELVATPP
jgi:uncharacterized protein